VPYVPLVSICIQRKECVMGQHGTSVWGRERELSATLGGGKRKGNVLAKEKTLLSERRKLSGAEGGKDAIDVVKGGAIAISLQPEEVVLLSRKRGKGR